MPKLNATHLPERIQEVIEQLERGEEVQPKRNKALLNDKQQKALEDAWAAQQQLRKQHKPPKTQEEKQKLGWKDKREVRIEIYKQALNELSNNLVDDLKDLQKQREAKAARIYLEARFNAKEGVNADSAGKIALQRAGFTVLGSTGITTRDLEIRQLEELLKKQFEAEMTQEEREQLELLKEHEKAVKKRSKQ